LPFLNVELPLVAFFALAPILFIIAHAYTLMHFVMLAAKVGTYDTELREKLSGKEADAARLGLRRQLPSNIFVQFLAGPSDIREGGLGWLLKAVAWISLVIGPVLLLLLLQIQFLPYHLWWVTWVQRFAVLADLILLWFLWPSVLASRSAIRWPRPWRSLALALLALLSLLPVGLAFVAARFPGEWLDTRYGAKKWIPPNAVTAWLGAVNAMEEPIPTSLHDLLFNGPVDDVTRRRKSLFSNTLVLPGFDALDSKGIGNQKTLDWAKHSLVLRGRHLEGAVFAGADLRKADLEGAQLQGAILDDAQLQKPKNHRTKK
jgi:Pentapeptide repeats (8 copies)